MEDKAEKYRTKPEAKCFGRLFGSFSPLYNLHVEAVRALSETACSQKVLVVALGHAVIFKA